MELYYMIAVVDRERGEDMASLFRAADLALTLTTLGQGTATDEHLSVYDLDATEKAVVTAVAGAEGAAQLQKAAKRKMRIDIPGNGIMMTIPVKSVAGSKTLSYLAGSDVKGGRPTMEFEYELIIVIMNEGYSNLVMDAAREAGAGGGTVLHAKGTAGGQAEKFFGVRLADEKDMVYIVAHKDEKAAIMRAVQDKAGPGTRAGAISFSLPISSVVGLRAREE